MAKVSTIQDNFNDNSVNTSIWDVFGSGVSESSQQFNITVNGASPEYTGVTSDTTYDATDSSISIELVTPGALNVTSWEVYPIKLYVDANNFIEIELYADAGEKIKFQYYEAGVRTIMYTATYSSTNHRWLRIREASGTLYFDASTDGISWNNLHSEATPITITSVRVDVFVGMWQAEGSNRTATFDNLNINNITISAGVLTTTSSLPSPTVTGVQNISIAPSVIAITFSIPTPTTTAVQNITTSADLLNLSSILNTPVVSGDSIVSVSALSALLDLPALSISAIRNTSITSDVLSGSLSIPTPTVTDGSGNVTIYPNPLIIGPYKYILVDGKYALRVSKNYYMRL